VSLRGALIEVAEDRSQDRMRGYLK